MKKEIRSNKVKNVVINMSLLLISIVIGLFVAEGALLLLGYKPHYSTYKPQKSFTELEAAFCKIESIDEAINQGLIKGPLGNLKYDETLGYTYLKNLHGFNDSKNFYDDYDEFKRVLVLGDSFTGGASAEKGHGYVDLLNQYYNNNGIIFFNTGVGGYAQNNQLAVLKKYFNVIKPHIVLLGFYTGNDFWENLQPLDRYTAFTRLWVANYEVILTGNGTEMRRRSSGEILNIYKRYIGCTFSTSNSWSLKEFVREKIFYQTRIGTQMWLRMRSLKTKLSIFTKNKKKTKYGLSKEAKRSYRYEITKNYLKEIKEFIEPQYIPFYILVIPDFHESTNSLQKSRNYQDAITLFNELNLQYIDPFNELNLQDYVERKPGSQNDHWNNSGHLKMFNKIVTHFGEMFEYGTK
jgi:hypothetical protein